MKNGKSIITFFTILFSIGTVYGQSTSESITTKKVFGGYQFYQGEKLLNINKLTKTLEPNTEAYKQIKSAKTSHTAALLLSYSGGFMVGWSLGSVITGGEPNWALTGIGAGLIIVSIPISNNFNKKAKQAVDTYNGSLQPNAFWEDKELNVSLTDNGLALSLKF